MNSIKLLNFITNMPELVNGCVLGTHDFYDFKSSSLFIRIFININFFFWIRTKISTLEECSSNRLN